MSISLTCTEGPDSAWHLNESEGLIAQLARAFGWPGVELGASDLAWRGKASGARRDSTANGSWVCPLCFHDGLSLQGLRLMLIQRSSHLESRLAPLHPLTRWMSPGTEKAAQLLVGVDEWGLQDQHFKSGPTRARAADLTVITSASLRHQQISAQKARA